jgi:succinate-semialdehyde dehydrogenase/glutarate-semialdehyde dehydrogenase
MFKSIHPFDQSLIEEFPLMNAATVQGKLDLASKAFRDWKKTSFEHRRLLMLNVAALIRKNKKIKTSTPEPSRWKWVSCSPKRKPR